ncbi:hypothetical protein STEG23_034163 [Scotinomys teguina]
MLLKSPGLLVCALGKAMALLMRSQCSMRSFQCPLDLSEAMTLVWGSSLLGDPEDHTVVLQCQHGWHLTQGNSCKRGGNRESGISKFLDSGRDVSLARNVLPGKDFSKHYRDSGEYIDEDGKGSGGTDEGDDDGENYEDNDGSDSNGGNDEDDGDDDGAKDEDDDGSDGDEDDSGGPGKMAQ